MMRLLWPLAAALLAPAGAAASAASGSAPGRPAPMLATGFVSTPQPLGVSHAIGNPRSTVTSSQWSRRRSAAAGGAGGAGGARGAGGVAQQRSWMRPAAGGGGGGADEAMMERLRAILLGKGKATGGNGATPAAAPMTTAAATGAVTGEAALTLKGLNAGSKFKLYNTMARDKELFEPLAAPKVSAVGPFGQPTVLPHTRSKAGRQH